MSDETLRELERAAASGDPVARDRYLREKARMGQPLYMADVLEAAGFKKAALSSVAKGVRAVCKLARLSVRVTIWKDANASYVYTESDYSNDHLFRTTLGPAGDLVFETRTRERFHKTFGINTGSLYHTHREDQSRPDEEYWHAAGPTLKPEHQEAFLSAVAKNEGRAPSRKPTGRPFQQNDVVTLRKTGARRRYVVSGVQADGALVLVALSGSAKTGVIGSYGSGMSQESVSLDPNQEIVFWGNDSGKLANEYRGRVGEQAFRGQS
jgi:hypothetical protein